MYTACPICKRPIEPGALQCETCGFKIVEKTQEFKPIKLDEDNKGETLNASDESTEVASQPTLSVIKGLQVGTKYSIAGDEVILGRNPNCDIFCNDMTVSRNHAKISKLKGTYVIFDLGSFNGVWVNNIAVDSKVLKDGDIIQLGIFCFKFSE